MNISTTKIAIERKIHTQKHPIVSYCHGRSESVQIKSKAKDWQCVGSFLQRLDQPEYSRCQPQENMRRVQKQTQARKQNSVSEMKEVHSWYWRASPNELPNTRPPTAGKLEISLESQ